jgi:hypothetical protein
MIIFICHKASWDLFIPSQVYARWLINVKVVDLLGTDQKSSEICLQDKSPLSSALLLWKRAAVSAALSVDILS